jgi:hypothetical protein
LTESGKNSSLDVLNPDVFIDTKMLSNAKAGNKKAGNKGSKNKITAEFIVEIIFDCKIEKKKTS